MAVQPLYKKAELEAYIYFDAHIRELPKSIDASIDTLKPGFHNNDVDAFRHAYVSGVFTQEFGEKIANVLGWMNELGSTNKDRNMDLWNNAVGRRLGKKHKTGESLARAIAEALKNGELIIDLSDQRKYTSAVFQKPEGDSSIIVLEESKTGANELFFDFANSQTMTRPKFVEEIKLGRYPGYLIRHVNGMEYPVSKRDGLPGNNLG